MAEYLLREYLTETTVVIGSAGLQALSGHPADPMVIELLGRRSLDATGHRGRQITTNLVREAELILVMEQWQQQELEKNLPQAKGRVFRLGHWQNFNIPDPYRQGREKFEESLTLIERGLQDWLKKL